MTDHQWSTPIPTRDEMRDRASDLTIQATRILDAAQAEGRELTDVEHERFEEYRESADGLTQRLADLAERDRAAERVAGVPSLNFQAENRDPDQVRSENRAERSVVQRVEQMSWAPTEARHAIVGLIEDESSPEQRSALAQWAWVTSSRDYYTAFSKHLRDPETGYQDFSPQEREAWTAAKHLHRTMSIGSSTSAGAILPSHLDPAIYLTNDGSASPIPALARQVSIATDVWHGASSDGVTMSWDPELTAVSDDSPILAAVTIQTFKAAGFVAASIEAIEDSNIAEQVAGLFADARDRLEAAAFATGNGTTAPTGIWTALQADTTVQVVSTTAATIGLVDLQAVYRATPVRWRPKAGWMMNPQWHHAVMNLGTAVSASYSANMTSLPDRLLTKPVYTDDFAPAVTTTTALDARIVFGDFSAYTIVRRVGMSVEFVPYLFDQATGRPNGSRGWYTHFRTGAKPISAQAFSELVDKTSA